MSVIRKIDAGVKNKKQYENWKNRVPSSDRTLYKEIQSAIDNIQKTLHLLEEAELKIAAQAIMKLRSEQQRLIYKYDFRRFVDEVFSAEAGESAIQDKVETPDFHIQLYNAYETHARVCAVCPRGHGKSMTARIWILHKILYSMARYIVIIGSSEDMAGQNLRWIRDQLTDNPKIIEIYGDLYNKSKWTETEFITSTKIKVCAKGAGQKIRGMNEKGRPDIVYIDDLEDDEMVETKERRAKLSNWFRQAVLPIISRNAKIIYTGTILDNDSLLKNVSKNLIKDHISWKVLFYQSITIDSTGKEQALWEAHKPLEILNKLAQFDPETFAKEYQNDPRAGVMGVFQVAWYNHYKQEDVIEVLNGVHEIYGRPLTKMCHTDFALSEKHGADFSVVMITGMDTKENLYILDYVRWRTSDPYEMLNKLFAMCKQWKCDIVTMEVVAFQKVFVRMFEIEQERRGFVISVIELTRTSSSKLQRIKSLAAPIQTGLIYWTHDMSELEEELNAVTALKTGKTDDIIDCVADAWETQVEHSEYDKDDSPPINSFAWMVQEGLIPTLQDEEFDD